MRNTFAKRIALPLLILFVFISLASCGFSQTPQKTVPASPSAAVSAPVVSFSGSTPAPSPSEPAQSTGELTVYFLSVGKADSIFIVSPSGKTMLVDAGRKKTADMVTGFIAEHGGKIDVMVATHPHEDHIGGLGAAYGMFGAGEIYMPKIAHTTETYLDLLEQIAAQGQPINAAEAGGTIPFDPALTIDILAPAKDGYKDLNNASVVLRITYGETVMLLCGDAESESEEEMLETYSNQLKSGLLKVAHHGSNTSSKKDFLAAVSPRIAIISCGSDEEDNGPSKKVLDRLAAISAEVWRTDIYGNITVVSDGESIAVIPEITP